MSHELFRGQRRSILIRQIDGRSTIDDGAVGVRIVRTLRHPAAAGRGSGHKQGRRVKTHTPTLRQQVAPPGRLAQDARLSVWLEFTCRRSRLRRAPRRRLPVQKLPQRTNSPGRLDLPVVGSGV